jgi:hypothetical protein
MDQLSNLALTRCTWTTEPFDNRWLHLFALDEAGRMAWRYAGDLQWTAMSVAADPAIPLEMAV